MKVGIIDYGVGNLGSLARAIEQIRVNPIMINRAIDLHGNDALILPGVGNFSDCMEILKREGWENAIKDEVLNYNKPILGICLGMQLLAEYGYEGTRNQESPTPGLGLIPGRVIYLGEKGCKNRIPHVGWNSIKIANRDSNLFNKIECGTDFYFVHSYIFEAIDEKYILAKCKYDIQFTAAVGMERIYGTQFHPEKSSRSGIQLLNNFLFQENA